jgi:signal transduction histidine kinase
MQKSGVLVITISNIGTDIFIVLKDNGLGLNETETGHIFELNYQGSNRISGNGLGLAQSKAIVDCYGGTIFAKSTHNQGMGIYIQLPANTY